VVDWAFSDTLATTAPKNNKAARYLVDSYPLSIELRAAGDWLWRHDALYPVRQMLGLFQGPAKKEEAHAHGDRAS
jgi:hypothetical protein